MTRFAPLFVLLGACSSADLHVAPPITDDAGAETADGNVGDLPEIGPSTDAADAADVRADGSDAGLDADAGSDEGLDTGSDAGNDTGRDAGLDAPETAADSGADGGIVCGTLIDDGTSSDGTLSAPCWPGHWASGGTVSPPTVAIAPAIGAAWPSAMLPGGGDGRHTTGSNVGGSLTAGFTFAAPVDFSAETSLTMTMIAGPTGANPQQFSVYVYDSHGTGRLVQTPAFSPSDGPINVAVPLHDSSLDSTSIVRVAIVLLDYGTFDLYIARPRVGS